jgi:SAM-dependent methyltransferase
LERYYHRLLARYFAFLVPPGSRVLEIGCGLGDLLAALAPVRGVGVDFSAGMIERAKRRHPELEFHLAEACECVLSEKFDYIILSDLINDVPDVQSLFMHLHTLTHRRTRIVINLFNNLWRPILAVAEWFDLKAPTPPQNWLSSDDVANLFRLAGFEIIKTECKILWPVRTPLVESFLNRFIAPLPFVRHLCLTICQVARPLGHHQEAQDYSCSVIIPARNEAENIAHAVQRVPDLGKGTELILIEGHSRDGTWEEIQRIAAHADRTIKIIQQKSNGKGGAVREAFAEAKGDLLFVLDADLSVAPEDLRKFYDVARAGNADFINGARLVYPMDHEAMRFCNMVANKFFSLAFSWLLGQPVKDTLCGTKALFRRDYEAIARNRAYFGDFDPFGDFDLLFGAAKLNLRIVDLPIRYHARSYGKTNIQRWRHGWRLLKMVIFGAMRLRFV